VRGIRERYIKQITEKKASQLKHFLSLLSLLSIKTFSSHLSLKSFLEKNKMEDEDESSSSPVATTIPARWLPTTRRRRAGETNTSFLKNKHVFTHPFLH